MKILLVGSPNAGKSTLFNTLTRGHSKVGNWHGVTVGVSERSLRLHGRNYTLCDLPGIYSVQGMSGEELLAKDYILKESDALLLFVAECSSLDRALPLLYALGPNKRCALVLTKKRMFTRSEGQVDEKRLSEKLHIPVLCSEGKRRQELLEELEGVLSSFSSPKICDLKGVYRPPREGLTRTEKLFLSSGFLVPFFAVLLMFAFALAFAPMMLGDMMKRGVTSFFAFCSEKCEGISSPVLKSFLRKGVFAGLGSVLSLLPQIAVLYLCLILLEESGLISRLAYLTDPFFSKIGLNGKAVFSLLMGFGCTAVAVLTTRGLDDKRMQRRTILCLPYLPCSAKLPVFLTLAASISTRPFLAVLLLYAIGVMLSLFTAYLLRPRVRPPFLAELDPLQLPRPLFVAKGLLFQLKQFIIKTATVVFAFFLVSWVLSSFDLSFRLCGEERSMLALFCGKLGWVFAPAGMKDWRITYAALSGLIAKENVAGAIAMLCGAFPYGGESAFAFAVFLVACSPCVSAIASSAREVGTPRALLYAVLQTVIALLLCYLTYALLRGGAVAILLFFAPILAFLCVRGCFERVYRQRKQHPRRVHR